MTMKGLRNYLNYIEKNGALKRINTPVSKHLEISGILKAIEPTPVMFEKVKESKFRVGGNLFCTKDSLANYFGITPSQLIPFMMKAIDSHSKPTVKNTAPCQEVVENSVDLNQLPILQHCEKDGGNYISAGIVISRDAEFGQNIDFHRAMQIDTTKFAVRIVAQRHFDQFLKKNGELDIAFCIGNSPNVLLAAAMSVDHLSKYDELEIANALEPLEVVKAKTIDATVPADAEFVLEGRIYLNEKHKEGPFVDLTETYDVIREEPVFEVKRITHRKDAIWQALLPGALEHKLLMGMPREPTIFKKVNEAGVKCLDVSVNPGGCSWLHAIVKIDKQNEEDGKKAITAAFAGHGSAKHVYVVDKDINIYDPLEVEWAFATRFQDQMISKKEKGSSLDPSSDPKTHETNKIGFDMTAPLVSKGKAYGKAVFPQVDLKKYI